MDTKVLGKFGEDLVCEYLRKKGYKILARNYVKVWDDKTKGEIDIIAKKDGVICFVEVKTQETSGGFFPEEKVDYKKQRKLIKLAQTWLMGNKIPIDSQWQIDVVGLLIDSNTGKTKIEHFENAVESEY